MRHQEKIGHAIVIGAGTAGLLAARVLRERAAKVTIIERDPLTDKTMTRRGLPQGQHFHLMMGAGSQVLNELFPSLLDELDRAGVTIADCGRDWVLYAQPGVWLPRFSNGIPSMGCTRTTLDFHMRRLLLTSPNIELRTGLSVGGLCVDKRAHRITGVRLARNGAGAKEEILSADLVVDVSGRGSRTPAWLVELGYAAPPDEEVVINLAYCTRLYRPFPGQQQPDWQVTTIQPDTVHGRRGGFLMRINGGLTLATLFGYAGEHPPHDEAGFLEFARSLPQPLIYDHLKHAIPAADPGIFKFPANRRRHYELLDTMPDGLVVLGDAAYATNPTHGQGMTMSCLAAVELGRCLDEQRDPSLCGLSLRFQKRLAALLEQPWSRVITEELRRPDIAGRRPFGLSFLHWYSLRILELCSTDRDAYHVFSRVLHMLGNPTLLLRPTMLVKVLRHRLRQWWTSGVPSKVVPKPESTPRYIMAPRAVLQRSYAREMERRAENLAG